MRAGKAYIIQNHKWRRRNDVLRPRSRLDLRRVSDALVGFDVIKFIIVDVE